MNYSRIHARMGAALILGLLSSACSTGNRPTVAIAPVQATDPGEVEAIAQLLDTGDVKKAKRRLTTALKRDPHNPSLMLLRNSIERDARDMLGPGNYSYTVRAGDTIGALAQRLLGNRLKSHQLARYNGIEGAATLNPGQILRIPGQPPRAEPARRPAEAASGQAPRRPASVPRAATATATGRPAAPSANPAAARQARSAGLAALNEGNPARAVSLLSRAAALDPANPAIARDLQRAQRVSAAVKARQ